MLYWSQTLKYAKSNFGFRFPKSWMGYLFDLNIYLINQKKKK